MNHTLLEPVYQPIFSPDGDVYAYEALLRLHGYPSDIGSLVRHWELVGDIIDIDLAMVRRIGEQLSANGTSPRVSINVSVVTVEAAGARFVQALSSIARHASLVIVELTETTPVTDHTALLRFYMACRAQGFAVAFDDCQPGHLYAATDFIANMRPQFVKLDGPFLRKCHRHDYRSGLDSIIAAAHAAGAKVVAEFISDMALHDFALRLGADYLQGHVLGKPAALPSRRRIAAPLSEFAGMLGA